MSVLWLQLLDDKYGLINHLSSPDYWGIVHMHPPNWFGADYSKFPPIDNAATWAIPAFVDMMGLWGVGGGMIIYLAGLKGIPASLYEAATIDGAGPTRKFWNITLPMLSPLIFYNLVMGIIGSFQIFTQVKIMTNGGPGTDTLFYVINLYRQAFEFHNMGYASAMAWVLFLIVLVLTLPGILAAPRNLVYYEGTQSQQRATEVALLPTSNSRPTAVAPRNRTPTWSKRREPAMLTRAARSRPTLDANPYHATKRSPRLHAFDSGIDRIPPAVFTLSSTGR